MELLDGGTDVARPAELRGPVRYELPAVHRDLGPARLRIGELPGQPGLDLGTIRAPAGSREHLPEHVGVGEGGQAVEDLGAARRYQPERRVSHPSQARTATEITSRPQRSHPDARPPISPAVSMRTT